MPLHARLLALCRSGAVSRRQRSHARTRPDRPPENRCCSYRPVPIHHLPQDRRRHIPGPTQDQRQRRRLAGIRHQPLNRRSRGVASDMSVRRLHGRCPLRGPTGSSARQDRKAKSDPKLNLRSSQQRPLPAHYGRRLLIFAIEPGWITMSGLPPVASARTSWGGSHGPRGGNALQY